MSLHMRAQYSPTMLRCIGTNTKGCGAGAGSSLHWRSKRGTTVPAFHATTRGILIHTPKLRVRSATPVFFTTGNQHLLAVLYTVYTRLERWSLFLIALVRGLFQQAVDCRLIITYKSSPTRVQ